MTTVRVTAPGRTLALNHVALITQRSVRTLLRQPMYLAFTVVQPMIWLLLFGQLFKRIAQLPGFGAGSYLEYLTPGVVVMTAMMSAGWAGTMFIANMERGVMDRDLVLPVARGSPIAGTLAYQARGTLAYQALTTVIQSLIVLAVGFADGARFPGGIAGILVVLLASVLLAAIFAALSDAVTLLVRQQEALIGVSQFLTLPLTFLSSVMMAPALMPSWVATVAKYNPVDWAAVACRGALSGQPDWGSIAIHCGLLAALALLMGWLSTLAFRSYQRSS